MGDDFKAGMVEYYDRRAPEYDDWYERRGRYYDAGTNELWAAELALLDLEAAGWGYGRVLEIACGTGRWTAHLAANPRVTEIVAVDSSARMLEAARSRLQDVSEKISAGAGDVAGSPLYRDEATSLTGKVRWVQADVYDLSFEPSSFDTLFAGFFWSHVPPGEAPGLLYRLNALLKPGGEGGLYDSLLPEGALPVQVQKRPLKDGSAHDVLKVYYTTETLRELLASVDPQARTWDTGVFFVAGRWTRTP